MYDKKEIEKHLKNICVGATSKEAMQSSIAKLGYPNAFVMWGEQTSFAMIHAPDGSLVIAGNKRFCSNESPKRYYIGNKIVFGWLLRCR